MDNWTRKLGGRTTQIMTVLLLVLTSLTVPITMASATEQNNDNSDTNESSEGGCYNVGYDDGRMEVLV
jgi:hypothetical protein